jgi:hypothetical protein
MARGIADVATRKVAAGSMPTAKPGTVVGKIRRIRDTGMPKFARRSVGA